MDTGAQDAALGAIRARWGAVPRAPWRWDDQPEGVIRVWFPEPHDLTIGCVLFPGDMETYEGPDLRLAEALSAAPADIALLLAALDAAEARHAALVAALPDTTLVEALVEVVFCEFGDRAGLDLGVLVAGIQDDIRACLTTAFREELVKAQQRALAALDAAAARQDALVALAHELVELEHGARAEQLQALHRLGIVVTLDEHLARARAFSEQQHARIDALAGQRAGGAGVPGEEAVSSAHSRPGRDGRSDQA